MRARIVKFPGDKNALQTASLIVSRGGLLVYPTDTVYGLGCDPFNEEALQRLVQAKRRKKGSLPLLADSLDTARGLACFEKLAETIAEAFWPGPLTLVLPTRRHLAQQLVANGRIGLRVPGKLDTLALIRECKGALVGTSANTSGQPASRTAQEAMLQLGDRVDLVLDGGESDTGIESTVLQVSQGRVSILREAAVSRERILSRCPDVVFT